MLVTELGLALFFSNKESLARVPMSQVGYGPLPENFRSPLETVAETKVCPCELEITLKFDIKELASSLLVNELSLWKCNADSLIIAHLLFRMLNDKRLILLNLLFLVHIFCLSLFSCRSYDLSNYLKRFIREIIHEKKAWKM